MALRNPEEHLPCIIAWSNSHRPLVGEVRLLDAIADRALPGQPTHEATRIRERGMRKFKSVRQAQRFVMTHAAVQNLFNLGRYLVRAEHYRNLRMGAFSEWNKAVA
jgi:hypothetical protein